MLDGQGRPRIHLNVLTYFLFWTAFYVLRGSHSSATSAATRPVRTLSLTPNFGSVKKVGALDVDGRTMVGAWDTQAAEEPDRQLHAARRVVQYTSLCMLLAFLLQHTSLTCCILQIPQVIKTHSVWGFLIVAAAINNRRILCFNIS